jgi:hypothetical protein
LWFCLGMTLVINPFMPYSMAGITDVNSHFQLTYSDQSG